MSPTPATPSDERPWEVTPAECHVPTAHALDVYTCQITCSCEWATSICGDMEDAWKEFRGHYGRAVDTTELLKTPRRPRNSPLQSERLFEP